MIYIFHFANYKLFRYEELLAEREIENLFISVPRETKTIDGSIAVSTDDSYQIPGKKLEKLTYFSHIICTKSTGESKTILTKQSKYESTCPKSGTIKRQSTRYGAHGLHDYKGKFNPQIVTAIENIFKLEPDSTVLEPFCGSGTTLYQSELNGYNAVGFDFNPLATFISNTKLATLNINIYECQEAIGKILRDARQDTHLKPKEEFISEREMYLSKWFEFSQLAKIESLYNCVKKSKCNIDYKKVILCIASNLIRDYSLQEPADLRIRRRKSELPNICFFDVLTIKCNDFLNSISSIAPLIKNKKNGSKAFNIDIRNSKALRGFKDFDAAVTSPPYATALPYIDTQRLSLIWLELATPNQIKDLENNLIGSRELKKSEEKILFTSIINNSEKIPDALHKLTLEMIHSLSDSDGFRRRAMPYVVYRYFSDMKKMFINCQSMLKNKAKFGLVVGHNQTTLGGKSFNLDTPNYLALIAESVGWNIFEEINLDTYKRYDIHKNNSINTESLIVVENN